MTRPAPGTPQVKKLDELKPTNATGIPAGQVTTAYAGTCGGAIENSPVHEFQRGKTGIVKIAKQGERGNFSCVTRKIEV